ncbi:MAG: tRNA lysidine(34) synthetase TilS [Oligoflexia bacterium]|nr:tRNA lysidine(34) synthetase TilS [Oligoflexia bacterium]
MSRPIPTVLGCLEREIPRGARILVAVSGGLDSVVLLHGLVSLIKKLGLHIEVAHVDHALRPTSARDAKFVSNLCAQLNLPVHLKTLTAPAAGENIEAWGREQRYSFFAECLESAKLDFSVTAHQGNDCAETLLMRLVSNKEPRGILSWDGERRVRRPLLNLPRKALEDYARINSVTWCEDETNLDTDFLRNKVRHKLLPYIEQEFGDRMVETLALRGRALAEDQRVLDECVAAAVTQLAALSFGSKEWLGVARMKLAETPVLLRWRLAAGVLRPLLGFAAGRTLAQRFVDFLESGQEGLELGTGLSVRRHAGGLELLRGSA